MMLCLAKEAKMELIREKVKKSLEAADGKRLDKIADLLVEAMLEHKKDRTSMANKWSELNEKFESTLME